MGGIGPRLWGAEVGLCWVGVGVPAAGEVGEEPRKVEGVAGTPQQVVKCPGVAAGLGPGVVGG